jgi:hypothetical protein
VEKGLWNRDALQYTLSVKYTLSGITLSILGMAFFSLTFLVWSQYVVAQASYPLELTGYLWLGTQGDTGLGWVSMNCSNEGVCGSSDYQVQINADRTITGYAWIGGGVDSVGTTVPGGFIRFGGVGCPSGNIDADGDCSARVIGANNSITNTSPAAFSGYEFTGWARACAVFQSGCSGALKSTSERGGWDGWISLNCENTGTCSTSDYAVTIGNGGNFDGYDLGWGGDVLGRVYFSQTSFAPLCTVVANCSADYTESAYTNMWCEDTVTVCPVDTICNPTTGTCDGTPALSGTLMFNPPLVRPGDQAVVEWIVNSPTATCYAEHGSGGHRVSTSGGLTHEVGTSAAVYTLYCVPDGGTDSVEVTSARLRVVPTLQES